MPPKEIIFHTLNQKRITPPAASETLFPELFTTDQDITGWMYSDLHNLYGEAFFPTHPSFSAHIWQNLTMPTKNRPNQGTPQMTTPTTTFYDMHVKTITHAYQLGSHAYKKAKDFKLSRYACWCMSRNNPYMIFSRTYFISAVIDSEMNFDTMQQLSYQFARVNLRAQLSKYEKIINAIANRHKIDFNKFRRINRSALFNDHSKSHIAERNDFYISPHTPLADHMGAATLHARANALRIAIQRINQLGHITPDKIFKIIFTELYTARENMIKNLNLRPENDIFRTPAPQIESQLARTERAFIKKYAYQR
ncbi:MAG: hypothetical protein IIV74_03965 [Alphaproteobacteria bacterium]|nr:hypothetical protein [Alphaproteobacteria bacterium]